MQALRAAAAHLEHGQGDGDDACGACGGGAWVQGCVIFGQHGPRGGADFLRIGGAHCGQHRVAAQHKVAGAGDVFGQVAIVASVPPSGLG